MTREIIGNDDGCYRTVIPVNGTDTEPEFVNDQDWHWRPQASGPVKIYTPEEIEEYLRARS